MKYQWFTFLSSNLQKVINWFSSLVVSTFIFRDYKFVPLEIKLMVFPFGPFSFMAGVTIFSAGQPSLASGRWPAVKM